MFDGLQTSEIFTDVRSPCSRFLQVPIVVTDNEDGTHSVEYMVEYAGFFAVEVSYQNVPVGESPYTACICNPTIAFPAQVSLVPVPGDPIGLPIGLPAHDMLRVHDLIVMLKSAPIEMTGDRREREFLHYYKVTSAMARGKEEWKVLTLRGSLLPPPARRECIAIDQKMIVVAHSDIGGASSCDGRTAIDTLRVLDLSDLNEKICWGEMKLQGKPPSMIDGYALAVWGSKQAILFAGGRGADGVVNNDIWMLTLSGSMTPKSSCSWRVLAEWPACIFSGTGFSERMNHSLTHRDGTRYVPNAPLRCTPTSGSASQPP